MHHREAPPGAPAYEFHLSVVATSRNDGHGGNLLARMQHFLDGFVAQCRRHGLPAELILVEWNPPADRPRLAEALIWPSDPGPAAIRIVTVPPAVHARLAHAEKLPLFQMIAKNAGIRRARGRFVLATNIDILFSDEVVEYLRDGLSAGNLYRADRADIPPGVPAAADFDEVLTFCQREMFRINRRGHTLVKWGDRWVRRPPGRSRRLATIRSRLRALWRKRPPLGSRLRHVFRAAPRILVTRPGAGLREALRLARQGSILFGRTLRIVLQRVKFRLRPIWDRGYRLHTNACGDFTLLSRDDWFALRGYPEWEIFSWHIDSVLLYQANRNRIREVDLPQQMRVYHIEHGVGSGYTPEGAETLFNRLRETGLPYLDWPDFLNLVEEMDEARKAGRPVLYNPTSWGLADEQLDETVIGTVPSETAAAVGR